MNNPALGSTKPSDFNEKQIVPNARQNNEIDKFKRRRWVHLRRVVAGCCGLAVLAVAVFWLTCERMIAPIPIAISSGNLGIPALPISLTTERATTVKGWSVAADHARATIVLLHPLRGSRLTMIRRAALLHRHGYSVVMIDLQGHGESPGDAITMGHLERHSAAAAVKYAKESAKDQPVFVLGVSLGGASFLLSEQTDINGLILESVYPTISEAISNRIALRIGSLSASVLTPVFIRQMEFRLQLSANDLRPIDQLTKLTCPVLMISGSADQHTTKQETQRMFAALPPRPVSQSQHELWLVNQAAHADLYAFAKTEYESRVLSLLERNLSISDR